MLLFKHKIRDLIDSKFQVYDNKKKDKKLDRRKRIKEKEERKFKKYHNKDFIEGEDYEDR